MSKTIQSKEDEDMPFANPFVVTLTWPMMTAMAVGAAMTTTALSFSGFSPFPIPA